MVLVLLLAVVLFFIIARRSRSPFAREQQQSGGGLGGRAFVRAPDRGGSVRYLFARACLLVLGWARAYGASPRAPAERASARQRSARAEARGARARRLRERAAARTQAHVAEYGYACLQPWILVSGMGSHLRTWL